jgi:hypothetical protein
MASRKDRSGSSRLTRLAGPFLAACGLGALAAPGVDPPGWPPLEEAPCGKQPLRVSGTTWYFCDCARGAGAGCVPGNDANAGTSPAAPLRTLAGATDRFNAMDAGDTVALCRTGAWDENGGQIHNPLCRASRTCDFRDYVPPWGTAASPRPRINADKANGFVAWHQGTYEGYRFWNLDVRHTDRGHPDRDGPKSFFIANASYVDICNVNSEGGYIGVQTTAASTHVSVRHSTFANHGWDALYVESAHGLFDSNTFINNGDQTLDPRRGGQAHTLYVACNDRARPCPGVVIRNNSFRTDPDGVNGYGQCRGVMLILRGFIPGLLVENNLFVGSGPYGCGAISTSGSYAYTEIHDASIRRNRVFWGAGGGGQQMLQIDACIDCDISANLIDAGGDGTVVGIRAPEQCRLDQDPQVTGPTVRNTFRNNSIRMRSGGSGFVATACDGYDYVVENNAVWTTAGGACFKITRPMLAGHPFNLTTAGNYCSSSGASAKGMWVDPTGDPSGDYRPARPGPLVGTANQRHYSPAAIGTAEWSPTDAGLVRKPPIDVGAHQRQR